MFDTKEDIAEILKSTPELHGKLSILLIGFYATNALNVPDLYGPQRVSCVLCRSFSCPFVNVFQQADGSYELALPMSGDAPIPIADLDADMGRWVEALFQAEAGLTLVGATEVLSWKKWLGLWAQRNNVTAHYRRATSEEYAAKVEGISDAVLEEFAFVEEYGFAGGNPDALYPDEVRSLECSIPNLC